MRTRLSSLILLALTLSAAGSVPAWGQPSLWEQGSLLAPDARTIVGASVATSADGSTFVVSGAFLHARFPNSDYETGLYVFVRPPIGWAGTIVPAAKLTASGGLAAYVGISVGITGNGDTIIVGAPGVADGQGHVIVPDAAYVFVRPAGGWASTPNATETATLVGSDVGGVLQFFGISVAIDDDTVIVGSLGTGTQRQAYLFVKPSGGWTGRLTESARLSSNASLDEFLGSSVAIRGDVALVGAPDAWSGPNRTGTQNGAVYVFVKPAAGWPSPNPLSPAAVLRPPSAAFDLFGGSVAIDGDTIVVGAIQAMVNGNSRQGVAYVFTSPSLDWTAAQYVATLTASDGLANDYFGSNVAVRGGRIVVAKPRQFSGGAYVFDKPTSGWTTMTESVRLLKPSDSYDYLFGFAVALTADEVIVGAPNGAAYVFGSVQHPRHNLYLALPGNGTGTIVSDLPGLECGFGGPCMARFYDVDVVKLTATADAGSRFVGWSGDCDSSGSVRVDADRTCTATFVLDAPTLKITLAGPGSGSVESDDGQIFCTADCSVNLSAGTALTLVALPGAGSTFEGWSGDCVPDGAVTMDAPEKTCTATFGRDVYRLTVTKSGSGTVKSDQRGIDCGPDCGAVFPAGQQLTLTATANPGWTFAGWSGDCAPAGSSPAALTMDGDKACGARFTPDLVSLEVSPPNPVITFGTQQPFSATGTYADGSTKDLTTSAAWHSTAIGVAVVSAAGVASSGSAGTTTISATLGSVSGSTLLTVTRASTRTTVTVSRSVVLAGQSVTVTATVLGVSPTTGVGGVSFVVDNDGSAPRQGAITVTSPTTLDATVKLTLAEGSHTVVASYSGDANGLPSSSTAASFLVVNQFASGTAVRGIVTGADRIFNYVRDRSSGNFAADSALAPNDVNVVNVGAGFASAELPAAPAAPLVRGPYAHASSLSDARSAGAAASRAIAYVTIINPTSQTVQAVAPGFLQGGFSGTAVSHASGAVYVFDRNIFVDKIVASGKSVQEFLLGGATQSTLSAWALGDAASLSLQPLIGAAPIDSAFARVQSSDGPRVAARLQTSLTLNPGDAVVIVFDLTVYAPAGSFADFRGTLEPAADFLTDPAGNPTPLVIAGLWTPPPPAAAALTLTPQTVTNALTTPVTVTATATTATGLPVPNAQVFLEIVAGPNAQPIGPGVTDSNGQVSFTYAGGDSTGTDVIQASLGSLTSNFANVTWTNGPLDHIAVTPGSASMAAGGSQTYVVQGRDVFDHVLGDVTAGSTFSITPDGSCTGATCTATIAGAHTVTATFNGKSATATLNVVTSTQNNTADLAIAISGPATATRGSVATYTVVMTNAGPAAAENATVVLVAGPGAVLTSSTPAPSVSGAGAAAWCVPRLESGQAVTFTVKYKLTKDGPVVLLATTVSDTRDPRLTNNLALMYTRVR